MKFKLGIVLPIAMFLFPAIIRAQAVPIGRWEIVHTSGDNSAQTDLYPGSFSTFLKSDGTGYTFGTFTNSICVIDAENFNIVPTWRSLGSNTFEITITVNNLGLGQNFSFIYTGLYDSSTPVPGDPSQHIATISGTYYGTPDVSACSDTTQSNLGNFVATFLPTISSGSVLGSLDGLNDGGFNADNGPAFDATVDATIAFSAPPAPGQIAGTVTLATNPTFNSNPCFATTTGSVVDTLNINANKSSQGGAGEYMFADGFDPQGVPTTLFLNGFSANLYTGPNTDLNATQISDTQWAVVAAIGEDNPAAGVNGVHNDGAKAVMVFLYGVIGGVCDGAGGVDAPFYYRPGKPLVHKHKKHDRRDRMGRGFLHARESEGRRSPPARRIPPN